MTGRPRTLAIGDIHGCDVALEVLLKELALQPHDTLVLLGDIVDRGPNTRRAVELLLDASTRCQMLLVLGNHEEMMLDALAGGEWTLGWLRYGGATTLESYGEDPDKIPPEHINFLKSGVDHWETDENIFIHANLRAGVPLADQSKEMLRWTHLTGNEPPYHPVKNVVCGHTPQRSGEPLGFPGWICIDTYAYGGGWLTAFDVKTDEIFQAKQSGEFRILDE